MLKATEAFNKLKKMNDELKSKVGNESQYVSKATYLNASIVRTIETRKRESHV